MTKKTMFEGVPDARQTDLMDLLPDVGNAIFRRRYRQLTDDELRLSDALKDKAAELYNLIALVDELRGQKGSRATSIAKTKLEEAIVWSVKELTS